MPADFALLQRQAATIASQAQKLEEFATEMEKMRKLLSHFINGHRREKRILPAENQSLLPFESSEEFQAARAEAEAQAEAIVQTYTVTRTVTKKKRDESLPSHLPRVEKIIEGNEAQTTCPAHGKREVIGYDTTETLVYKRPELYVLVRKYPKYACPGNLDCGVASPERPTSLVEGDRYDTSVATAVVEAKWFQHLPIYRHQDIFAGSGWTPSRSTLVNLVGKVDFVVMPLIEYMTRLVHQDMGVGIDDTGCRMLLPRDPPQAVPGDAKSHRLAEKVAEALAKRQSSLLAKMWAYSGLHLAPYNIFDFRVSRHRDGPDDFFRESRCIVQGDNHWQALNVYVRDGRIPIDNNSVEQLMKQVAMGRKAWLFVCSVAGGEQSARMMTLVSSARRHDLDVGLYIKDVLDQLLAGCTDYHRLLPDVWKQSHRRRSASIGWRSVATRRSASNLKPPAAVWPPAINPDTRAAGAPKTPVVTRPDMGLVTAHP